MRDWKPPDRRRGGLIGARGPGVSILDGPGDVRVDLVSATKDTGANQWTHVEDKTYRVRVTRANDGTPLTFGAQTNLNQGAHDEFFALDNVQVRGVNDPG